MTRHYLVGDVAYPEANLVAVESGKPVVVIDPDDREQVERLVQAYADLESGFAELMPEAWTMSAMRMRQALREFANPKPPKPDEPTGLGAVVVDSNNVTWVLAGRDLPTTTPDNWRAFDGPIVGDWKSWDRIDAVRVLSEGVTSGGAA